MPGIVMVDGDPIEPRLEVLLHLPHKATRVRLQIAKFDAVLGGDNKAELVSIFLPTLGERLGVGAVLGTGIGLPGLPIGRDAIALQIAQMGSDGLAVDAFEPDDAGLDDDPARAKAHAGCPQRARLHLPAAMACERGGRLAARPRALKQTAWLAVPSGPTEPPWIAALLGDGALDQSAEWNRCGTRAITWLSKVGLEFTRFV